MAPGRRTGRDHDAPIIFGRVSETLCRTFRDGHLADQIDGPGFAQMNRQRSEPSGFESGKSSSTEGIIPVFQNLMAIRAHIKVLKRG